MVREQNFHNNSSGEFTNLNPTTPRGLSHKPHTRLLDEQIFPYNKPICASTDEVLSIGRAE